MITATFGTNFFEIKGHADYAPHGADIVCASVSVISQAVAMQLSQELESEHLISSGYILCTYQADVSGLNESDNDVLRALLQMLHATVSEIARQHPEHVEVVESDGIRILI